MKRRQGGISGSTDPFELSVNVFGPRGLANEASQALSEVGAFLQHPRALDSSIEYHNPDLLSFPGLVENTRDCIGMGTPSWKADKMKRDVENILESLDNVMNDNNLGPITGLKSTLTRYVRVT